MNTPGANAVAVAELTLGLMISMCRKIPLANATMHAGKWDKKSLQGSELRGKTLGIVGLRPHRPRSRPPRQSLRHGTRRVRSRSSPRSSPARTDVTLVDLDDVFNSSDFLTLHVGLTTQTEGMINQHSIAIMKQGVRIINCARGELIVDAALAEGIKSGKVAGAALDVFHQEPLKDSVYFGLDNVLLSPHIAGATDEAQEAIGIQLACQVRDYLKLGVVQNAVNLPSLSHEEYIEVAPYIEMAGRLGQFLAHSTPQATSKTSTSTYAGRLAQSARPTSSATPPSPASSHGYRRRQLRQPHQRRRGRAGARHPHPGRQARVRRRRLRFRFRAAHHLAQASEGDTSASATVLHGNSPRLLTYDGIDIEAPLQGTLVAIRNHDVPRRGRPHRHHPGRALGQHRQLRPSAAPSRPVRRKSRRARRSLSCRSMSRAPRPRPR